MISLYRNSASPATNDDTGAVIFQGENSADEKIQYARLDSRIGGATDGAEYGRFGIDVMTNGSSANYYLASFDLNQFYKEVYLGTNVGITFEGSAYNDHETTITATNPTADRTITLPDATGTVALTSDIPSSGISSGNVATFTSGVADNDFLRVDGTAIEGRSASEVLSDIAAMPLAGGTFTGNVTLSNVGDVTLTLEADTDNATESDNPSLVLSQDGGGTVSKLRLNGVNDTIFEAHTNGNLHFQDSSARDYFKGIPTGAVELYHNNSKKLETASGGISVTGEIAATSLDISGDVDVDGTLEADAITVNGTALNTVIADEATALAIALG